MAIPFTKSIVKGFRALTFDTFKTKTEYDIDIIAKDSLQKKH